VNRPDPDRELLRRARRTLAGPATRHRRPGPRGTAAHPPPVRGAGHRDRRRLTTAAHTLSPGRFSRPGRLPAGGSIEVPIFDTVLGGRSIVGTRQDLAEVFALHAAGRTRVVSQTRKLDEVNACFEEVLASRVPARLVFEF
jgi:hypothetical protein